MKKRKILNIKGALLDEKQLEKYLENIASEHILQKKSNKKTYPIYRLEDNFEYITKTYEILNLNLKQKIGMHPAGEWLVDNYYIIEETYKMIKKELTLKKYVNFIGISNGLYKGFARIYILASEIVAYTEGKIEAETLKTLLVKYQNKKTLNMEEIWNISIFFDIALIEKIRNICEKIYNSQLQKYKVESIIERLVENVDANKRNFKKDIENENIEQYSSKETYIEYLSYRLKLYGKKGLPYIKILEEQVEKTGTTISDVIKKEHFDIALKKIYMGNCIKSIKNIQRINFTEIFEDINGVENILKKDPANVYESMDHKTKDYYRGIIKKLSTRTMISEIYIATKALELAKSAQKQNNNNFKKKHIGYYLISDGVKKLEEVLGIKVRKDKNKKNIYIGSIIFFTSIIDFFISLRILTLSNVYYGLISLLLLLIPISEIVIKIIHYVLGKAIKPKVIPKIYFRNDIPEEYSTMVVIPTILDSKEKVNEMFKNLEVYFWANKTENLYFTLLGDCTTSTKEKEEFDNEIIEEGKKIISKLNNKYKDVRFPKFNFIYRKRVWNEKENRYLGWERKRGILCELNEFLLGKNDNTFIYNSMETLDIPKIKYVITLDADTKLVLDSAKKLVGAMAHILNTPILDKKNNIVIEGYGIIQPRINIDIESTNRSLFTRIFAGIGGIDFYSNAISDIYQDNFKEGIFTGKGIYDLEIFSSVLKEAIPENTVLSHDLLEGLYLKCGLATDIFLMDSFPSSYNSYMTRASRWVRGDWQIIKWLRNKIKNKNNKVIVNPLGELDKFKILDNLRRSLLEITQVLSLVFFALIGIINKSKISAFLGLVLFSIFINLIIEVINYIVYKKEGVTKAESFANNFGNIEGEFFREVVNVGTLPFKAYNYIKSIIKTLYRVYKTKRNLLQWVTAEEAEKNTQNTIISYIKKMWINMLFGILFLLITIKITSVSILLIGVFWIFAPFICYAISKKTKKCEQKISKKDKEYLLDIAKMTWRYFEDYLVEEYNYLPPDNYQESRPKKIIDRTSSTNIGLSFTCVISAYDFGFINLTECLKLIEKMLASLKKLPKWNGHLYNWYNIKSLTPLRPEYISTVDSGNFIGYMYIVKVFLEEIIENKGIKENIKEQIEYIEELIKNTDFSKLYDEKVGLLSIGFSIDENKITPSYYDLLASEARQASLIAIAKRDINSEHWSKLSRTLTVLNRKKGLISWSGTAFEYLMPNMNIKRFEGSLLDESCKFMIMSQKKYCEKLGIPWGISESAFNLKDLNSNYQYKAFGIPWLGLKRGLEDEAVISSYGSIMALQDYPEDVIKNIKILEKNGMYNKYGFYEAIDYTPERLSKGNKFEVVKTYMAHHQALILLSINNYINNDIIQKRFNKNPEIEAVNILLQEKMPEDVIITKEKKETVEKIKYRGYDSYVVRNINKIDNRLNNLNIISSEDYMVYFNQDGTGYSKYKDILINRYKETDIVKHGIQIYFKNMSNNEIWDNYILDTETENYKLEFYPDMNKEIKTNNKIETSIKNIIAPNENVEIRNIKIKNNSDKDEILEITSVLEPILSTQQQDIAHKAFNNLFLKFENLEDALLVKRNKRGNSFEINMAIGMFTEKGEIKQLEYEIDKEKLYGRLNYKIPKKIINSEQFGNKIGLVTDPIVALKRTVKIKSKDSVEINLIISVNEDKLTAVNKLNKYRNFENVKRAFEISRIRIEEEARYLRLKGKDIVVYQKILSYVLRSNYMKKEYLKSIPKKIYSNRDLWKYGISGDNPIILVKIKDENDIYTVKEILKAYEYYISKKITIDLVILDNETNVYEKYIKNEIEREIYNLGINYLIGNRIFIIDEKEVENTDIFTFKANLILDTHLGNLENIMLEMEEEILANNKKTDIKKELETEKNFEKYNIENLDLKYSNSYGGFEKDGLSYVICVDENIPSVWSNVLTNGNFGSIVSQNLGGYTWYKNSRLNRISRWSNDSILDTPSESIYIKDYNQNKVWRVADGNSKVRYGFGYVNLEQKNNQIKQEIDMFVPVNDNAKISILRITNNTNKNKKLNLIYRIDNVLGEDEQKTNSYLNLEYDIENDLVKVNNLYKQDVNTTMYVYSSEKIKSFTGNSDSINIYRKEELNNENSLGNNSCCAIEIEVELNQFEEKEISLVLGGADENIDTKFKNISRCKEEYVNTKRYWSNLLGKIRVKTPDESLNIMLNGLSMYQTIASRLFARSGFNQSGGAFGFRDQLQDCIGLEYLDTNMVKKQIIKHAAHQFIEGDVEHWWHDESKRGIRTKFSDDRLWLVYLVIDYISFTEDYNILEEKVCYIKGKILREDEDENYDLHEKTEYEETIYSHCIRAINVSLKFGNNGLPLIGTGDWNDGFNTVGNKGKGESVWLGFFLYDILNKFIKIAKYKNDITIIKSYTQVLEKIKIALNTNGWDEKWYKRAFSDDGKILGCKDNKECRIDSIAQSWSVISEAGDVDKKNMALESLEKNLIDNNSGIIKLLDPPFEKSGLEPGYIKSYLPGVRENGGQYTHAAIWAIIAFCKLGLKEKAEKYFSMINPIYHSNTKEKQDVYKIEPYVIPADIYGSQNLLRTRGMELVYRLFKLVL